MISTVDIFMLFLKHTLLIL